MKEVVFCLEFPAVVKEKISINYETLTNSHFVDFKKDGYFPMCFQVWWFF